ncbi:MAG: phosphatidate cytidylyltransferase [Candidatus Diapherotrites archaeon]|nr:phosphatidate cytidylyltransferase [Candidatus Diapherotrites archaeon]
MRKEIRRQFIHFFFGSIFIILILRFGVQPTLLFLSAVFLIGLLFSFLLKKGLRIPLIWHIVKKVERDYEQHLPGKGALLLVLSAIIVMALFWQNQMIALGALCTVVYGDSTSTVIGISIGKHKILGKRTWEGTLGGMFFAFIFLQLLFPLHIAFITAAVGMAAELLPFDDNFTIPIAAGVVLAILI